MAMSITEHEEKMLHLRTQVQQNQVELQDYLSQLKSWEKDIKKKENVLKSEIKEKQQHDLPPVRNTIHKKKLKKVKKDKPVDPKKPKRISGFDFKAWDKFDVDKALEEVDQNEKKKDTSSSEYETDEEWETERKKYLAGIEKEKGNEFLKNGDFEKAIQAYSKGMQLDPTNAILPANRAMALLKQQKFAASELDCTLSLTLDPLYVKAYLRRAAARSNMSKLTDAVADFKQVLDLEPTNKHAKAELDRIQKEVDRDKVNLGSSNFTDNEKGIVKPIYKPPEERSKVPLKLVAISEIGLKQMKTKESARSQSEVATKLIADERKKFDKLISSASTSLAETANENVENTAALQDNRLINKSQTMDKKSVVDSKHDVANSNSSLHSDLLSVNQPNAKTLPNKDVKMLNLFHEFSVPTSSFQFQNDYKLLKNKPDLFINYFQAIAPSNYVQLFGQSLDVDILKTILTCLKEHPMNLKVNLYDVLLNLTKVNRFSMICMFLSQKEKQVISDLIQLVEKRQEVPAENICLLRKSFDL